MVKEVSHILEFVLRAARNISLYFIIGIAIASLIKTLQLDVHLRKAFQGNTAITIPLATGAGAFSPLCSCGVIPAIAALLATGVPLAPIMAFWITSPLMDPQVYAITHAVLGKEMAVAKLFATLIIGLTAGFLTLYLSTKGFLDQQVLNDGGRKSRELAVTQEAVENSLERREFIIVKTFQFMLNFKDMAIFVGKYVLLAFVLESLLIRHIPMEWVGGLLGNANPLGPLLAAVIGIPAYSGSISSIPVIRGLMALGMDKGTALALMIGGQATSIPAMVAVYSLVKRRTFLLYLAFSMTGAILSGYIYRLF